jgi:hypothetical protein
MHYATLKLLTASLVIGLTFPLATFAQTPKQPSGQTMPMAPSTMGSSMGHMESAEAVKELPPLKADLPSLLAEVERLRKEVARLDAIRPTFTNFMPDFAERFHVMHYAGDAGDWAVANHEAMEMDRMVEVAQAIDPQKGTMMKAFIGEDLEHFDAAIGHSDKAAFDKALKEAVVHCNACHTAVGSAFIKVSLNVAPNMTIRHPHILTKQHATAHKHSD